MKMKNDTLIFLALWFSILLLGAIYFIDRSTPPNIERVDTVISTIIDTLWKDTTITEKEFVPKIIERIKTDTVYTKDGDTLELVTEAKKFDKSIISDKDTADLEIFTSGINTSLDSLKMRLKTHKEIVTNTVEITKIVEKKKTLWDRFHIGLQGGYGYAFKSKELTPYVGIGGSFDL